MITVDKKENESNGSLMRRFSRKVQSTGLLIQKKKRLFHEKEPNKRAKRDSAIRRKRSQDERAYLIKVGKIEETPAFGPGRFNKNNKKKPGKAPVKR